MIYPYNNETQTSWDRGAYKVQLNIPGNAQPMGFCDGTPEDLAEISAIAENEGVYELNIHKKVLKSGREIWTLGDPVNPEENEFTYD
ncbi:hypothetical protein KKF91_10775 [Myxococcota bacterium]|nr:hypothetical protein [Myxococcota bacterium]MBU1431015.1 hypothetical protein [Myxococcota bacterium]MBU1898994.1 hypothetical protein [Myxococcota bacterium]